jgi:hypothetical protein
MIQKLQERNQQQEEAIQELLSRSTLTNLLNEINEK